MGVDDRLIEQVVERILKVAAPRRVILFGSAATGRMARGSDIDLLVLEDKPDNELTESVRIGDMLRGLGFPFDVIVMPTDRFEESKEVFGGIAYPAHRDGKVIYEAA